MTGPKATQFESVVVAKTSALAASFGTRAASELFTYRWMGEPAAAAALREKE